MRHLDRATQIEHRDRLQRWADGPGPLCYELGSLVQSRVGPPAIGVVARRQAQIEPHYHHLGRVASPPYAMEMMLRIHLL